MVNNKNKPEEFLKNIRDGVKVDLSFWYTILVVKLSDKVTTF